MDCDDEVSGNYGQDLIKFMYSLRVILRDTNAVAFVTIPAHLFDVSVLNNTHQYSKKTELFSCLHPNLFSAASVTYFSIGLFSRRLSSHMFLYIVYP